VTQPADEADLGHEAVGVRGRAHLLAKHLHGDATTRRGVVGEKDVSHGAALQQAFEPVPRAERIGDRGEVFADHVHRP